MKLEIKIEGLKELNDALAKLPKRTDRKLLNASLMIGGRLIRNEARLRAPILKEATRTRRPGTLRRMIRAARSRPPAPYEAQVIVGVRKLSAKAVRRFKASQGLRGAFRRAIGKAADNPDDPFYWWFVENGTSRMGARPYLRPAFESRKVDAALKIRDDLRKRIDAEAVKLGRSAPRPPRR